MVKEDELDAKDNIERKCSPYLNIEEAAAWLKISPHTLNKWRYEGRGPAFRDHGRRVFYHIDDLDAWSQGQKRQKSRTYGDKKLDVPEKDGGAN